MQPQWDTVAIIGVGAIGASIGMAIRQRGVAREVIGVTRTEASAEAALEIGAVDQIATRMEDAAATASFIVVCTPVMAIADHVRRCSAAARADTLLTDGGSTKGRLCRELASLPKGVFVGSHPLAGTHEVGPRAGRADLLQDRMVLVTPVEQTPDQAVQAAGDFWKALGAKVRTMEPEQHDRLLAFTSHAPHVVAYALAAASPVEALELAASGWKDTTRIAQGDVDLWRQILLDNPEHTLAALANFETQLAAIREAIASRDHELLTQLLSQGKKNRDAVGN